MQSVKTFLIQISTVGPDPGQNCLQSLSADDKSLS